MTELEYTAQQNKRAIDLEIRNIEIALEDLKTMLAEDSFGGSRIAAWTGGYVARDVSKVAALLSRQGALLEASRMIQESEVK